MRKARFKAHTLLLIWPPYDEPMALECLKYFRGDHICYIGEGWGGCTGCDGFHDFLGEHFNEVKKVSIPQWEGLHDRLFVYERR